MSDDRDFEARLKLALNTSVDADLGPRRPAPPFRPATKTTRRPVWLLPLAVAATVAIVSGGAVGIARLSADRKTPTGGSTAPAPSPDYRVHKIGRASIAVPTGWKVVDAGNYGPGVSARCLAPAAAAPKSLQTDCPVNVRLFDPASGPDPTVNVDNPGGVYGDPPQYCLGATPTRKVEEKTATFGGRAADYRYFHITCPNSAKRFDIEQYVVATDPGAVVSSGLHATPAAEAAIEIVAAHSTLPTQDRPLRLYDAGVVQAVTAATGGTRVQLDGATYLIPAKLASGHTFKAGQKLTVYTDGNKVIQFY